MSKGLGRHFPLVGAAVVAAGIGLHVTRLVIGDRAFTQIYTPLADAALFVPMLVTAVCMLMFRRRVRHDARWGHVLYWTIAAYFWASVPIHIWVLLSQSNDLLLAFPRSYSVALQPWLALQLHFFFTLDTT